MRRKQTPEEIAIRQKQILETALGLLIKEDYQGITIRRITTECGIATGTFFNYFPSKENLFLHLPYSKYREYFQDEQVRFKESSVRSFEDYKRFMLEGARNMFENRQELIRLFILHHEILSSAQSENVPKELNEGYIASMNETANAIHDALPAISVTEALRNYSFFHAHMIGTKQIAPISTLGAYYPVWFDAVKEMLHAFERYLEGTRMELGL